jgi:catechol 2,3-dioxygenase-like lactoylglutathione lyase family enzyme
VPELGCTDVLASLEFYTRALGFTIKYQRPEKGFYYLERQGAVIMIEQLDKNSWLAASASPPLGRGMHFEIVTDDLQSLYDTCQTLDAPIFRDREDAWYRVDDHYSGQAQFIVSDPDGYLLRFTQDIGRRDTAPQTGRVVG